MYVYSDKQSDFQMFTVFSSGHIGTPIWAPIRILIRPTVRVISHQPLDFFMYSRILIPDIDIFTLDLSKQH